MVWEPASGAPEGAIVMTKIDDARGARNEGPLVRRGNMWWQPDGSIYVYYSPTHWRPMTAQEADDETARLRSKVVFLRAEADLVEKAVIIVDTLPAAPVPGGG